MKNQFAFVIPDNGMRRQRRLFSKLLSALLSLTCILIATRSLAVSAADVANSPLSDSKPASRGYQTTPQELALVAEKAARNEEPYRSAVAEVLSWAGREWDFDLDPHIECRNSDNPRWIDDNGGVPVLYAKALAYHLTGDEAYAAEVVGILERVMTEVRLISTESRQCQLNFGWGTPEYVAAADLVEAYWHEMTCTGPVSTDHHNLELGSGSCKVLFQNWLVKNPYYIVSYAAEAAKSNWGAAATNTLAYIADYLWDRDDVRLVHRYPAEIDNGQMASFTPAEAFRHANMLALRRMNGYDVEYMSSSSCDYLRGSQQSDAWPPVKSQITPTGIIPEDARRDEYCNIQVYDGSYQNYPQIHLSNNIQQCELMLRRGDSACFDNVDMTDIPEYPFQDPEGKTQTTHLHPGRGSIERAINAIIIDSGTEWRHDAGLEIAYRYYVVHHRLDGVSRWLLEIQQPTGCTQAVCFGTLTHGFAAHETPALPPVTAPGQATG